jgi:hypothetical protein
MKVPAIRFQLSSSSDSIGLVSEASTGGLSVQPEPIPSGVGQESVARGHSAFLSS